MTTQIEADPADRADLRRRLRKAWEVAKAASDAGDARKQHKAMERVHLRTLQIDYLDALPERYECPRCLWGNAQWPGLDLRLRTLWDCPAHHVEILEGQARELAAEEALT